MATRGWQDVTSADIARMQNRQPPSAKPTKYRNTAVMVDNRRFDSKKEAARYLQLVARQQAGEIRNLECQPEFELWAYCHKKGSKQVAVSVGHYRADFRYELIDALEQGEIIIEDVKSSATRTPVYLLKKKLTEACHNIVISEV